jgi:hypothetical protein
MKTICMMIVMLCTSICYSATNVLIDTSNVPSVLSSGTIFTVSVDVENAKSATAIQFNLNYNKYSVKPTSVIIHNAPGDFAYGIPNDSYSINEEVGRVVLRGYGFTTISLADKGTFATVTFEVHDFVTDAESLMSISGVEIMNGSNKNVRGIGTLDSTIVKSIETFSSFTSNSKGAGGCFLKNIKK